MFVSVTTAVSVHGLQVELSQDDLKVLLRILMENLGEAGGMEPATPRQEEASLQLRAAAGPPAGLTDGFISSALELNQICPINICIY